MRVYYFTCAKWALDDLEKGWLKVCRFSALNDPFELFGSDMKDKERRTRMRDWASAVDQKYGLLCFCKDWHDPLMWSHYGDRHRGICLGFDVDDGILREIDYSPKRLQATWHAKSTFFPAAQDEHRLLTTKYARWSYERECRVIVPLAEAEPKGEYYYRRFGRELRLARVIAGPRCTTTRKAITEALGHRSASVDIVKARLAFKTFRVVKNLQGISE